MNVGVYSILVLVTGSYPYWSSRWVWLALGWCSLLMTSGACSKLPVSMRMVKSLLQALKRCCANSITYNIIIP